MTDTQIEAVAAADAHLQNAGLPTVSAMREAMRQAARALEDSAAAITSMDARLLKLTDSPAQGERGEATRALTAATLLRTLLD